MPDTQETRLRSYARQHGMVRPRDLQALGIPREILKRLVDQEALMRLSRGIYVAADYEPTVNMGLAQVALRAPKAVICLLSALRFHELTTQSPFEVWIMIGKSARRPTIDRPRIRVTRASGKALTEGVEIHELEGVPVRITSPAKTVADCFKYRNKIGLDVAIEALRDAWRSRKVTMDQLYYSAKTDRVAKIMRPYMESLV